MLKNFILLRSQRNRVYEMLREAGLEPAEFSWSKEKIAGTLTVSRLNHRDGIYFFQFSSHEINSWCLACPGRYRWEEYEYPKNWEEQEDVFRRWAKNLRRELDAPEPWEQMSKYRLALAVELPPDAANEVISAAEAGQIANALTRLAERIKAEFALEEPEAALVRDRLGYLTEAARRERGLDWVHMALGVCVTLAMGLSLPEEGAVALWRLLAAELGSFIHLIPRGPGSLPVAGASAATPAKRSRFAAVKDVFTRAPQPETSPEPQS